MNIHSVQNGEQTIVKPPEKHSVKHPGKSAYPLAFRDILFNPYYEMLSAGVSVSFLESLTELWSRLREIGRDGRSSELTLLADAVLYHSVKIFDDKESTSDSIRKAGTHLSYLFLHGETFSDYEPPDGSFRRWQLRHIPLAFELSRGYRERFSEDNVDINLGFNCSYSFPETEETYKLVKFLMANAEFFSTSDLVRSISGLLTGLVYHDQSEKPSGMIRAEGKLLVKRLIEEEYPDVSVFDVYSIVAEYSLPDNERRKYSDNNGLQSKRASVLAAIMKTASSKTLSTNLGRTII